MNADRLKRRPSLEELAAKASSQWVCPRCGSTRWWVRNSYFVGSDNSRHRKRECRNCHHVIYTREIAVEKLE